MDSSSVETGVMFWGVWILAPLKPELWLGCMDSTSVETGVMLGCMDSSSVETGVMLGCMDSSLRVGDLLITPRNQLQFSLNRGGGI